jgi:hypothetical protein
MASASATWDRGRPARSLHARAGRLCCLSQSLWVAGSRCHAAMTPLIVIPGVR